MAATRCPKCNNGYFEAKELPVQNSRFQLMVVQCAACGAPVSIMDNQNIGNAIDLLEKELKDRLTKVESNQGAIYSMLQTILHKVS
jgi:predicted nucleic-acid-binding Zn-ribbon protein